MRRGVVAGCLVLGCGAGAAGSTLDNQALLDRFAQATGQVGRIEADGDGGVRITWEGALSLDLYRRQVTGPPLLTPYRSGGYARFELESDRRDTDRDGRVRWLRFGAGLSDDTAVLPTGRGTVRHLSVGEAGQQHRWAVGDVPVEHSALGIHTPLRGVLAELMVGDSTLVSFSAGTLAESWEALADESRRTLRRRDLATLMLTTALGTRAQAFATVQGFADQGSAGRFAERFGWLPSDAAPASGRSATAGLRWRDGAWFAQGEIGASRGGEEGEAQRSDAALVLDMGWDGDGLSLRAGHHDIGRFFGMVSSLAASGIGETYANANWTVTRHWGLTLDVRRSRNDLSRPPAPPPPITVPPTAPAAPTPNAGRVDSVQLGSRYALASVDGLAFTANVGRSRSTTDDASSDQRLDQGGVGAQWAHAGWNAALGWQHTRLVDAIATTGGQRGSAWTTNVGRSLTDARADVPATWQWSAQLSAQLQRQRLAGGTHVDTDTLTLGLNGERVGWGRVGVSVGARRGNDALGNDVRMDWVQLEGARALGENAGLKLYLRDGRLQHGPLYEYREQLYGLQLSYRL